MIPTVCFGAEPFCLKDNNISKLGTLHKKNEVFHEEFLQ